MIVKMQKYAFLVYHKEYEGFLQKLRDLGVVHVEPTQETITEDDTLTQLLESKQKVARVIKELHKHVSGEQSAAKATPLSGEQLLNFYSEIVAKRDALLVEQEHYKKELALTAPWGEFDPALIDKLQESGKLVSLFSCSSRNYKEEWEADYDLFKINQVGSLLYFAIVTDGAVPSIEADLVKTPKHGLSSIKQSLEEVKLNLSEQYEKLTLLAEQVDVLEAFEADLKEKLTFAEVVNGSSKVADAKVAVLQGWVAKWQINRVGGIS